MKVPLDLTFRHLDKSPAVASLIEERADKLAQFHDHVLRCRVVVERPHRAETSGSPYQVVVDISVAGAHPVVVTEQPGKHALGESLQVIVKHAFDAAERTLKKLKDRQRANVKQHEEDPVDSSP